MLDIIPQDTIPQKQCKGPCGQFLPATTDYFSCKRQKYKGVDKVYLYSTCKRCAQEAHHAKYLLAKANPPEVLPGALIVCSVCKNPLPATDDFFDRSPTNINRYGFASECKPCKTEKAYARRRTPKGRTREKELRKVLYDANPEHFRKQRMRYFYANQEIENERCRIYGRTHRHERSQHRRIYAQTHPNLHRARKRAIAGTYTFAQIAEQLKRQHYRCYYARCGFAKFKRRNGRYAYEIDHTFPISRVVGSDIPANDMSYLVLACKSCNSAKRDKFPWEWPAGGRLL